MRNNNNIGFYIGFSVFAIQTIAGDYYRDYKQQEHNSRMNRRLFISGNVIATRTTTTATKESKY